MHVKKFKMIGLMLLIILLGILLIFIPDYYQQHLGTLGLFLRDIGLALITAGLLGLTIDMFFADNSPKMPLRHQ